MSLSRLVCANRTVFDQADLYAEDGSRIAGATVDNLDLLVFFNNAPQAWDLEDGATATDNEVRTGRFYFNEILEGYYSVRFRPNATGHWRFVLTYSGNEYSTQVLLDFDVATPESGPGLYSSFFK